MILNNIYGKVVLVVLVIFAVTFSACSNDDDNGSGAVVLEAFGPSPALRGSELTFIGKNLDKVTSVILPEGIEVTDIEVVSKEKIKITIPQDAKEGYVKLVASGLEITTKTLLKYTEPISITKFAPSPVKAGQTLTIEGDYLNLIQKVVFSDNVEVSYKDFLTWERKKIEVVVPREAQTGIIILADTAAIPVELKSETELQVVLPSVEKVLDLTNKKPGDVVSTIGQNLDLVESVQLPDGAPVAHAIKDDVLAFTLPEGITDGAIVMVAYSGVHVAIANIGVAVPTDLVATPATGIKDGSVISIKGVNMDLVTTALFPGVSEAVTPTSKSATEIKVTTPANAKTGDLILNTASGKTVSVKITTLKPEILSYNPSSVAAGNEFTIKGKNLDLVTSVTFGGNKVVEVTPTSSTDLVVKAPVDAETGELTFTMKNGETVKGSVLTVTKPDFCYIPVLPGSDEEIKSGTILKVDVQNADKLTNVQVNGNNTQYILQGSTLSILVPNNANGNTAFKLISSNGEVTYTIRIISSGIVETVIMNETRDLGSWAGEGAGGAFRLYKESFDGIKAGAILKFYFTVTGYGQLQINNANWATWDTPVFTDTSLTYYEMELTQPFLDNILGANDGWSTTAIVIQGEHLVISKVSIITGR
ncbi:MAG TPA: IPT/TIG domain-containing protein [Dysgonomonas sp.]|uniref:IPT/TIG domain-containing protein n=1 Tax=unclassified Dysgonomonas TaxID=2630389 RepID=UPI0025BC8E64|nr:MULTISPECIES: IPT/TIG domain-containing protein [unclassified Dysgonomonas]HML63473.1 IPT/TIG domain-containing protein [Dysgonomonas sp.]